VRNGGSTAGRDITTVHTSATHEQSMVQTSLTLRIFVSRRGLTCCFSRQQYVYKKERSHAAQKKSRLQVCFAFTLATLCATRAICAILQYHVRKTQKLGPLRFLRPISLISVSLALTQTWVYTVSASVVQRIVHHAVCLLTHRISLLLTATIPMEGWPGRVNPGGWLHCYRDG